MAVDLKPHSLDDTGMPFSFLQLIIVQWIAVVLLGTKLHFFMCSYFKGIIMSMWLFIVWLMPMLMNLSKNTNRNEWRHQEHNVLVHAHSHNLTSVKPSSHSPSDWSRCSHTLPTIPLTGVNAIRTNRCTLPGDLASVQSRLGIINSIRAISNTESF